MMVVSTIHHAMFCKLAKHWDSAPQVHQWMVFIVESILRLACDAQENVFSDFAVVWASSDLAGYA
jgi:hypothetical protein